MRVLPNDRTLLVTEAEAVQRRVHALAPGVAAGVLEAGVVFALVPVFIVVPCLLWLDRFEAEPGPVLLRAFLFQHSGYTTTRTAYEDAPMAGASATAMSTRTRQ